MSDLMKMFSFVEEFPTHHKAYFLIKKSQRNPLFFEIFISSKYSYFLEVGDVPNDDRWVSKYHIIQLSHSISRLHEKQNT